ncbi:MAG TPA: RlmE family RNA methyltransferase [Casimicrobiaceae bacterium]|nr:RlmE family RNA methyltransferase [Casimicrobiaceae bacterium]
MRARAKSLHPAAKKHKFGKVWMHEHVSDHWVQEARRRGYRSRAAFKLIELAAKDRLLRPGMTVLDLGAAPGSWCQVLRERLGPMARIIAVDLLPMDSLAGVHFIRGDLGDAATLQAVDAALLGHRADLVVCDMAPNISGIESADQARSVHLGELALELAARWLQPGGDLVVKAFQGEGFTGLTQAVQAQFDKGYVRKPKASRDRSREVFLVGKGFRPAEQGRE